MDFQRTLRAVGSILACSTCHIKYPFDAYNTSKVEYEMVEFWINIGYYMDIQKNVSGSRSDWTVFYVQVGKELCIYDD